MQLISYNGNSTSKKGIAGDKILVSWLIVDMFIPAKKLGLVAWAWLDELYRVEKAYLPPGEQT